MGENALAIALLQEKLSTVKDRVDFINDYEFPRNEQWVRDTQATLASLIVNYAELASSITVLGGSVDEQEA